MKSLLSISLLSVMLNMCGEAPKKVEEQPEQQPTTETVTSDIEVETVEEINAVSSSPEKPEMTEEMPDTSRRMIIEHGSPDQARTDSVKAAKTKGKFN